VRWLVLIAGPNGAGKSTLTGAKEFQERLEAFPGGPAKLFNPDDFAKVYYSSNPKASWTEANLWAANQVPLEILRCIDAMENVLVETVLSSRKYDSIIEYARAHGYKVGMLYLVLGSPSVSTGRVAKRVAAGGHDVPEDRIRPRWHRSLNNLFRLAPLLDGLLVYRSTSDGGFSLLAEKHVGRILWYGHGFSAVRLRLHARKPTKPGPHTGGMPPLS